MSDWKIDAANRRDERHTKTSDEPTKSPKISKKKKDTKKWCRGKEGVEHKLECRKYNEVKQTSIKIPDHWRILVCSECGKELDVYIYRPNKSKPKWVDK